MRTEFSAPLAASTNCTMKMNSVGNKVHGHLGIGEHFTHDSRFAMMQGPHGVEGMGGVTSTRRKTRACGLEVGVGVAHAHAYAAFGGLGDDFLGAIQFWG